MKYRGFEVYATQVPEELSSNGAGKVFACEIYRVEDDEMSNVLCVFDLVEGKDIPVGSDEALISALKGYVDTHYAELLSSAFSGKEAEKDSAWEKIDVRLNVHKESVLAESGQESLEDAITQELGWLQDSGMSVESWSFSEKEKNYREVKPGVFAVFEKLVELQNRPEYMIAKHMAFLQNETEPDVPLTDEDAYALALKFEEARGSWFSTPVLHAEYLEALKDLLECGVNGHNLPSFPVLSPEETRKLLLAADEQVFGTLVEAAAVENCYRYAPYDYKVSQEDRVAVEAAAVNIKGLVVDNVLAEAIQSSEKQSDGVEVPVLSNKELGN